MLVRQEEDSGIDYMNICTPSGKITQIGVPQFQSILIKKDIIFQISQSVSWKGAHHSQIAMREMNLEDPERNTGSCF